MLKKKKRLNLKSQKSKNDQTETVKDKWSETEKKSKTQIQVWSEAHKLLKSRLRLRFLSKQQYSDLSIAPVPSYFQKSNCFYFVKFPDNRTGKNRVKNVICKHVVQLNVLPLRPPLGADLRLPK